MNLWERDILPRHGELEQLPAAARLRIAVESIDWTVRTSSTPIEYQRAETWITEVITAARTAVAQGAGGAEIPGELIDQYDDVDEDAEETGVSQLLMGIANLWGSDELTSEELEGIFYSNYVFSQQREVPEPETLEQEEASPRCVQVIAHQAELITQSAA